MRAKQIEKYSWEIQQQSLNKQKDIVLEFKRGKNKTKNKHVKSYLKFDFLKLLMAQKMFVTLSEEV